MNRIFLSWQEKAQLAKWLTEQNNKRTFDGMRTEEVVPLAIEALGFPLTATHVRRVRASEGVNWPVVRRWHKKPASDDKPKTAPASAPDDMAWELSAIADLSELIRSIASVFSMDEMELAAKRIYKEARAREGKAAE